MGHSYFLASSGGASVPGTKWRKEFRAPSLLLNPSGSSSRGRPMRGRKPCPLAIAAHDRTLLQEVARAEALPWYQVRRARTVLAIAAGQRAEAVASHLECDTGTVWRTRQGYKGAGL